MALLALAAAKTHLKVLDDAHDVEVAEKTAQAEDAILRYLDAGADPLWTSTTVPASVTAAIEVELTWLYVDARGLWSQSAYEAKEAAIVNLLRPWRKPVLA